MRAIELDGVRIDAGARAILGPLSLAVEERAFVLVVGPSGAGKTTLLRTIAGLALPACGTLSLFGKPASSGARLAIPPERREVGFLFQGGGLWPHLSVRRTLDFVLRCRGHARDERARRVGALVELVELHGLEERRPGELSGGEVQRLALARALAGEPRLLLLDEPLGPLDSALRGALAARLGELHRARGLTTLYVSHDAGEVAHLATARVRLERGALAADAASAGARGAGARDA